MGYEPDRLRRPADVPAQKKCAQEKRQRVPALSRRPARTRRNFLGHLSSYFHRWASSPAEARRAFTPGALRRHRTADPFAGKADPVKKSSWQPAIGRVEPSDKHLSGILPAIRCKFSPSVLPCVAIAESCSSVHIGCALRRMSKQHKVNTVPSHSDRK